MNFNVAKQTGLGSLLAFGVATSAQSQLIEPIPQHADVSDTRDGFGWGVAVDGDRVVWTPFEGRNPGEDEVFLFRHDGARWYREASFSTGWEVSWLATFDTGFARINPTLVALDGDWLSIGSPLRPLGNIPYTGEVNLYNRTESGWVLRQALAPPMPAPVDTRPYFGAATALWNDWLAVGEMRDRGPGLVHLYRQINDQWVHRQTLQPGVGSVTPVTELRFSGGRLLVRTYSDLISYSLDVSDQWASRQFVFHFQSNSGSWGVSGDMVAAIGGRRGPVELMRFQNGSWVSAGSGPELDPLGSTYGLAVQAVEPLRVAAYGVRFEGTDQSFQQVVYWTAAGAQWSPPINIEFPSETDQFPGITSFGFALAFAGDRLFVGNRQAIVGRMDRHGAGYSFGLQSGLPVLEKRFAQGNGFMGDTFGRAVAADSDWLVVSAPGTDGASAGQRDVGRVHFYRRTEAGWEFYQSQSAATREPYDVFGSVADLRGDLAVVGSLARYGSVVNHGQTEVFKRQGESWNWVCRLAAPIEPDGTPFGFSSFFEEGYIGMNNLSDVKTDGELVAAIYRKRVYAWRVVNNQCELIGEVPLPLRYAAPGEPGTETPSPIYLDRFEQGRLFVREDLGSGDPTPAELPTGLHVVDFDGRGWQTRRGFGFAHCPENWHYYSAKALRML